MESTKGKVRKKAGQAVSLLAAACLALALVPAASFAADEIDPTDLANATIAGVEETVDCTGKAVTQSITVTDPSGNELTEDSDYSISYEDNVAPGTATLTISGVDEGTYTGSQSVGFTINDNTVLTVYDNETVDGQAVGDASVVKEYKYGDLTSLAAGNTGTLACFYNTNVQATDSYVTFDQVIADAYADSHFNDPWTDATDPSSVSVNIDDGTGYTWSAAQSKETLETTYGYWYGDATVSESNIVSESKTGTAVPASIGLSYEGVGLSEYQSADAAAAAAAEQAAPRFRTFIGSSIDDSTGVVSAPRGNMMVSDVHVLNVYYEQPTVTDLANGKILGVVDKDCTGQAVTQSISVYDAAGTELTEDSDYSISYEDNVAPGTATLTVTGMEPYTGSLSTTFTINDNTVLTVYDYETDDSGTSDAGTTVKEYKYGDLTSLAAGNTGTLACFYNTNVQATDSYVTFDQVIADAYASSVLSDPWTDAADPTKVSVNIDDGTGYNWSAAQSKEALTTTYGYWYGDATIDSTSGDIVSASKTGTAVPASIGLSYVGVGLSGYENADAAAKAAAEQAAPRFRVFIGSSVDEQTGVVSAPRGNMMVSDVHVLNIYHGSADTPATDEELKTLENEITSAQSALNGVKISADGSDVASSDKWVTQDVYDALQAAIATAQAAYATPGATSEEIEAATSALSSALATFQAAQKSGTKASSTTKVGKKKQNIKCKTKVKLKKNGKKVKIKVKGVKTTLCWKANKKAQKALKIVTSTKTLTLKALKKAKKGKTYKIKLWAGVGNNYAKSKVKTIKVKIK